jgi:hypothetical protein
MIRQDHLVGRPQDAETDLFVPAEQFVVEFRLLARITKRTAGTRGGDHGSGAIPETGVSQK